MMKPFIQYDPSNGRILASGTMDQQSMQDHPGAILPVNTFDPTYDSTHYVAHGKMVPRPACPAMLSGQTLRRVPVPSTVIIGNIRYSTDEADVEMTFQFPGTYKVAVQAFPFLDGNFAVTV
jgi:hypothetical protein